MPRTALATLLLVPFATPSALGWSDPEAAPERGGAGERVDPMVPAGPEEPVRYDVEIDAAADLFHVTVAPGPLTEAERYFDFVGFAPGVHSQLDFGRFVHDLAAFDAEGEPSPVERVDVNRWELAEPEAVARITYSIEDSFDTEIDEHRIIPCGGTGIDESYALVNTFGVCGYFETRLATPVEMRLAHDAAWRVGTALEQDGDGVYFAESYRGFADRPLLLGSDEVMTSEAIWVGDIEVEIFVRSTTPGFDAESVLFGAGAVLEAVGMFLGFAPVDRYVLLIDFMGMGSMGHNRFRSFGALEHSTSSLYTLPAFGSMLDGLPRTIAHEFMHVLTPLHLRSEVIANFDYSIPTTDQHLWLYEGLTEWAADILRLRSEITDLEGYLEVVAGKISSARRFNPDYGLARLSAEWATEEGGPQYGNIYQLGALTGVVLDIRILELSGGQRGLREVFLDLIARYGKEKPFDAETFFDEFVEASYPEVADFLAAHVQDNEPLPYAESFAKLGIDVDDGGAGRPRIRVMDDASDEALALREAWMRNLDLE